MPIILDSSVFINSSGFSFLEREEYFMTSLCVGEIKEKTAKLRLDAAWNNYSFSIQDPCPASIQKVRELMEKHGDSRLSSADESVVALAIEKREQNEKVWVYTDDFSIQNLLKWEKIPFSGILQGTISRKKSFKKTNST